MTAVHEGQTPARTTRRLSILPVMVGLLGALWAVVGAWAAGIGESDRPGLLLALVACLVLATVASGSTAGLYAGLGLLIIASLGAGHGPIGRGELVALVLAVVATHETVRFSLDARRPSRFGPGLVRAAFGRALLAAVLAVAVVVALRPLAEGSPARPGWIPVGLAAAGLPVLALAGGPLLRRIGGASADRDRAANPLVVGALAVVVVVAVSSVVVIGARARTAVDTGPADETSQQPATSTATTTTALAPPPALAPDEPTEARRGLLVLLLAGITLLAAALYLALRRPEALFELDELVHDDEDRAMGLAAPRLADTDPEVEVGDDDLARLLADVRFDIEHEPDPGRAVRYAYATMERRLAELGVTRAPEETERELLLRSMQRVSGGGPALTELTRLFERARFAVEAPDESMRSGALAAIAALEEALAPALEESNGVEEPTGIEDPNTTERPSPPNGVTP